MPSSTWVSISHVLTEIMKIKPQPQSVLDIGVGFGRWGILLRECLDCFKGRYYKPTWKTNIEGIEIFPDYIQDYHKIFYDKLHIGNVLDLLPNLPNFDLIIAGDVLEHFPKDQGYELIDLCKKKSTTAIFGVPIGPNYPQKTTLGNVHETHRAVWEYPEFPQPCQITKFSEKIKNRPYGIIKYQ